MNYKKTLGWAALALTSAFTHAATLTIDNASDWGNGHSTYNASNVIDGSLAWASRWAASGSPVNLVLDLGSVNSVSAVGISWGNGGTQTHSFEIWARASTSDAWVKVRQKGDTTGNTSSIESYDIDDINAQYIRIKTHSNSAGSTWTNIKEVEIYGDGGSTNPDGELDVSTAFDDGTSHSSYPASKAIDDNTAWSSRWAAEAGGNAVNLTLELASAKTIENVGIAWGQGDSRTHTFEIYARPATTGGWTKIYDSVSSGNSTGIEMYDVTDISAQQVRVKAQSNSAGSDWMNITEVKLYGSEGTTPPPPVVGDLDPNAPPSENFNLTQWYVSVPTDDDGNGKADSIKETDLNNGYEHSDYFYTANDGGMVFRSYVDGYKTSTNTSYTRTELREMLRAGDTSIATSGVNANNWVFSSAPSDQHSRAGGVDGNMKATLKVDHVTDTGDSGQVGRVIVGQIHAAKDEPIRLYYRLLPGHSKGSIYFAHEPSNGNAEQWYEMIGSRDSNASEPSDGIALGEVFSYEIDVNGDTMTVKLMREGKTTITEIVDMSNSGYDGYYEDDGELVEDYMYFKAGVYNQNNTGDSDDYVQATFYALEHTHD